MRTRLGRRIAVVAAGVVVPLLASAAPAMASIKPDDGQVKGPSLGVGDTLLLFVVIPIAAFLVIAALSVLPSALARPRYRPGKSWEHEPVWVNEPGSATVDPVVSAGSDSKAQGGASAEW